MRWDAMVTPVLCAKEQCEPCSGCNEPRSNKQSGYRSSGLGLLNPNPICSHSSELQEIKNNTFDCTSSIPYCVWLSAWEVLCFAFTPSRLRELLFHKPLLAPSLAHWLQCFWEIPVQLQDRHWLGISLWKSTRKLRAVPSHTDTDEVVKPKIGFDGCYFRLFLQVRLGQLSFRQDLSCL